MHRHQPPSHRFPVRVYYEDTDAAGVVYYANYLKFCERARTEWLRALGFEQQTLREERSLVFVVRTVEAEYLKSGVLDDALTVETSVAEIGRSRLVFAQSVMRGSERLFDCRVGVVCVDWNKRKPASVPPDIRALMTSHHETHSESHR
ncbi:tol-pal system-associated acyl-CoA thioesterase [Niveibacterium umoris]|uniref:Acyl-CoA thioester hydrolase n=1 Tax=Niveibacterium umoris TaxID=1193620 RepID=A0A840BM40_9RHOO|nr:tol-pal system-associated acyl-CoA thioesterase [Niveibacterium umoris]MBB4014295.1 acyl-CoA thioester hydrolase [Niveibacterium umoris]